MTDGPFAETREVLGGFYLILAKSAEDVIELAARHPGVGTRPSKFDRCLICPICQRSKRSLMNQSSVPQTFLSVSSYFRLT